MNRLYFDNVLLKRRLIFPLPFNQFNLEHDPSTKIEKRNFMLDRKIVFDFIRINLCIHSAGEFPLITLG